MMIYDSYIDACFELPDKADRMEYLYAVVHYLKYGKPPKGLKGVAKALFTSIEPSLHKTYVRSQAGKAAKGKPKTAKKQAKDGDGFEGFVRESLEAYNRAAGTQMLALPETAVYGLRKAWDNGRRIQDVESVLAKTVAKWEPRYRTPKVFEDKFEYYLSREEGGRLAEGGDEW